MATAADAAKHAKTYLGVRESPMGSNKTPIGIKFGWNGVAWCAEFTSVVSKEVGLRPNVDFPWTASVPAAKSWFIAKGRWGHTPHVGDWVCYSNQGRNGSPYHVEMVVAVTATHIVTVGGNTSGDAGAIHGNGDGCYEKTISRSTYRISGYGSPFYNASGEDNDFMSEYVSIDKNDKSRHESLVTGQWHQIYFNKNNSAASKKHHSDGDYPSLVQGGHEYNGVISLRISGMPEGVNGQVRCVYVDGKTSVVKGKCYIAEFKGSAGDTFITHQAVGYVPTGQKMRVEVISFGANATKPTVVEGYVRLHVK